MSGPIRFGHISDEEGLPTLGVYAIVQDRRGFMWFGTQNGLARYDGVRMAVYKRDDNQKGSISGNDISALAIDKDGRLWVGTSEKGLNRYNEKTDSFERFAGPQVLTSDAVSALHVDKNGLLWVGLATGGVVSVDPKTGKKKDEAQTDSGAVVGFAETAGSILFVGAQDGVSAMDISSGGLQPMFDELLPSSPQVTALHLDKKDRLWLGTKKNGVIVVKDGQRIGWHKRTKALSSLSDNSVTEIFAGPDDSVWVGTEGGGINEYLPASKTFVRYMADKSAHSFSYSWVTSAFMSRDGTVWVGTLAGGVNTFDRLKRGFKYYRANLTMTAVFEDELDSNTLWMGSQAGTPRWGGLYKVDRKTNEYTIFDGPIGKNGTPLHQYWIATFHQTKRGDLWIGTGNGGLIFRDRKSGKMRQFLVSPEDEHELRPGGVTSIVKAPDGMLWLATWGDGVIRFNPKTYKMKRFNRDSGLGFTHAYAVMLDKENPQLLWVGTAQGGLNLLNTKTGEAEVFANDPQEPNSLPNDNVVALYQDSKGYVWAGTYGGGLARYDPKTRNWKRYNDTKKHPTTIYGIVADSDERLWLSTNGSGLRVLNPRTDVMDTFSGRDGLPSDEFAGGAWHRGKSGTIYFGVPTGALAFHPRDAKLDERTPPLVLTNVKVFDKLKDVPSTGPLELSYRDSVVTFDYAMLAFSDPKRTRYEYMLEGLHEEWLTTNQNSITFPNLDSGDFTFRVRATGRHKVKAEELTLPLSVSTPPWRSWWAYLIYVSIIAGSVLAYLRYQRQRIRALEKENRLVTVERELELTAAVQTGFLPKNNTLDTGPSKLYGFYRAADQCSGDWWWYERMGEKLWVLVGDVTGHGPGPAMVTAAVGTAVRVQGDTTRTPMVDRVNNINREVLRIAAGKYQMCLTAVELDERTGNFTVHSAGGLPIFILRADGQVKMLLVRGTPVGTEDFILGNTTGKLEPGERLMALTDGLPEIMMPNGRMLGMRSIRRTYKDTKGMGLEDTAVKLVNRGDEARAGAPQEDDWTFVIVDWNPGQATVSAQQGA